MLETLKYLTQIKPARNYKNIDSLNNVALYLEDRFKDIGLKTLFQNFLVDGNEYKNVVATLNLQYEKRLVIGAHYDVCGNFQGADDNASAVAGLIQTAKQLYEIKNLLPIRIDFVCFTLEEPPYYGTENMGSHVYAKYLFDNKIDVIGMINYEMIGYYTNEDVDLSKLSMFITKKQADISKGNFIAIVSDEQSQEFMSEFDFEKIDKTIEYAEAMIPTPINQITASDHLNFWKFGYKAIMVTDTAHFRNPNYHSENDILETLDIKKMYYVVDLIVNSIKQMVKNFKDNAYYAYMKDPKTGFSYNIPMLRFDDPEYINKYIEYMKMKEEKPEQFQKILNWD
jgi:Zn-dependent M28 family amino/carboxypeptidase